MSLTGSSSRPATSAKYRGPVVGKAGLLPRGWRSRTTWRAAGAESLARWARIEVTEGAMRDAIDFQLNAPCDDGSPIPPPSNRVDYAEVAARKRA